jgi:hypothetical protein
MIVACERVADIGADRNRDVLLLEAAWRLEGFNSALWCRLSLLGRWRRPRNVPFAPSLVIAELSGRQRMHRHNGGPR